MNSEIITPLGAKGIKQLFLASERIPLAELVSVINTTVQWGPIPTLNGELYEIDSRTIPLTAWIALNELIDWGAAAIPIRHNDYEIMRASVVLVDLFLLALSKILRSLNDTDSKSSFNRPKRQKRRRENELAELALR